MGSVYHSQSPQVFAAPLPSPLRSPCSASLGGRAGGAPNADERKCPARCWPRQLRLLLPSRGAKSHPFSCCYPLLKLNKIIKFKKMHRAWAVCRLCDILGTST